MSDTEGLLIMPRVWRKLREEQLGSKDHAWRSEIMKFAKIRASGRVGEICQIDIANIGSITLMETYTTQKRWYRALIAYNKFGRSQNGCPMTEFMYFYADPWVLGKLAEKAAKAAHKK